MSFAKYLEDDRSILLNRFQMKSIQNNDKENENMFENRQSFKFQEPRSIPVILLLDTSGSMCANGNIDVLNTAVKEMLKDFASQNDNNVCIKVAIYKFGPEAKCVIPLKKAIDAIEEYEDLDADGGTPLGAALSLVKRELIEDKEAISSRSYRPTVILVSDGMPNDSWEEALDDFCNEGRSSKCYRMALAIGSNKGTPTYEMLTKFAGDEKQVFSADESSTIKKFFKYVTISTISRTVSSNPNLIVDKTIEEMDEEDELKF